MAGLGPLEFLFRLWSMPGDERSQQPVPFELTLGKLKSWRAATMYTAPTDLVFASERVFGKMPIWAVSSFSTTMQIHTHARMEKKREAQSKVVDGCSAVTGGRLVPSGQQNGFCARYVPLKRIPRL